MFFYLIIAVVTLLDQASKYLVRTHFKLGDSVPIWHHAITLTYYQNSGAAGSSFQGYYRSKGQLRGRVMETPFWLEVLLVMPLIGCFLIK
jgi:lipoprotein signal peptidase